MTYEIRYSNVADKWQAAQLATPTTRLLVAAAWTDTGCAARVAERIAAGELPAGELVVVPSPRR